MFYTSKEYGEGTGLGLSISQKIVESFSGELIIEDVNIGASFKISLPLVEFSTFSQTNDYLTGEKDQEDPKILLIAENVDKLNEIYKLLEKENVVLITSKNIDNLDELIDFYSIDFIFHFGLDKAFEIPNFDLSMIFNINKDLLLSFVGHHE